MSVAYTQAFMVKIITTCDVTPRANSQFSSQQPAVMAVSCSQDGRRHISKYLYWSNILQTNSWPFTKQKQFEKVSCG